MPLQPVEVHVEADLSTAERYALVAPSILISSPEVVWIKFGDSTVTATAAGADCIRIPANSSIAIQAEKGATHVSVIAAAAGDTSIVLF
jgi:hypothetical protein